MNHENDFPAEKSGSDDNEHGPTQGGAADRDIAAELKRRLEESRLPAELRKEILAALPSPEEQERLYRQLLEHGGLSSEEFLASLGIERERQP